MNKKSRRKNIAMKKLWMNKPYKNKSYLRLQLIFLQEFDGILIFSKKLVITKLDEGM